MDSLYNFKDETESDTRTNFRQTHPYFESATWLTYIKEYDFALVCEAAARDDFQLVEDILEALIYKEYHSTLSQLIEADHYSVFISVFKNSRVDLLQKLWSLTTLESQRLEMLEAVFGRIAILDFTGLKCIHNLQQVWAWAKDLNQHQILLETYGYTALESVPGNVASMIWNWAEEVEDLQREWLNRNVSVIDI